MTIAAHPDHVHKPLAARLQSMTTRYLAGAIGAGHSPRPTMRPGDSGFREHGGSTLRDGIRQATLIAMLRTPDGATIAEIASATGLRPRTVRAALCGALKKTLGLTVASEKTAGRGRCYRIA